MIFDVHSLNMFLKFHWLFNIEMSQLVLPIKPPLGRLSNSLKYALEIIDLEKKCNQEAIVSINQDTDNDNDVMLNMPLFTPSSKSIAKGYM